MAGGGLKSFKSESLGFELPERTDVVLYKENGTWRGIVQGYEKPLPEALTKITKNWLRLKLPERYDPK